MGYCLVITCHDSLWNGIIHTCFNFGGGLAKLLFMLRYSLVIAPL